jgi:hypothetical protein
MLQTGWNKTEGKFLQFIRFVRKIACILIKAILLPAGSNEMTLMMYEILLIVYVDRLQDLYR